MGERCLLITCFEEVVARPCRCGRRVAVAVAGAGAAGRRHYCRRRTIPRPGAAPRQLVPFAAAAAASDDVGQSPHQRRRLESLVRRVTGQGTSGRVRRRIVTVVLLRRPAAAC